MSQTETEIELRQYAISYCRYEAILYERCNFPDTDHVIVNGQRMTVAEAKELLAAKAAQWRHEVRQLQQEGVKDGE